MTHARRIARRSSPKPGRSAAKREMFRRGLVAERLEARTLLAGDLMISDWWNSHRPQDVNADGHVAPIDALLVINALNQSGSGKLSGSPRVLEGALPQGESTTGSDSPPVYYDVNNDGYISPLDALLVINDLNAEGEGELMQYEIHVYAPGTKNDITTLAKGQEFDLAIEVTDKRPGGLGVFSAYIDVLYDSSKARVRVSEFQEIELTNLPTSGTFTLSFNGQTTTPITFSTGIQPVTIANNIRLRLEELSTIGAGNVEVQFVEGRTFQVRFKGALGDTDVPMLTGDGSGLGPNTHAVEVTEVAKGVATDPNAFREAFRSRQIPGIVDTVFYRDTLFAEDLPDRINDVGALGPATPPFPGEFETEVVRARMVATDGGPLSFTLDLTNIGSPQHDTLVYATDPDDKLTLDLSDIDLAVPIAALTITEPISAGDDGPVLMPEDTLGTSPLTNINVLANDSTTLPGTLAVRSVSSLGITGSVSINANGTIKYVPASNFAGTESFTYVIGIGASGGPTDTGTVTVTVEAVNDAPVNAVPGTQNAQEDTPLVLSGVSAIVINDVDAGTANMQVTLAATNGTLTMGSTTNLTVTGNGTANIIVSGSRADINTGLSGLTFNPTSNFSGQGSIAVTTSDLGNTGSGGPLQDSDTITINVAAVNDAPLNTVPGSQSVDEGAVLTFSTTEGNAINVNDIDAAAANIEVTLSVTPGSGVLNVSPGAGVTGNGTATLVLTGSQSAINTRLNGLTFTPAALFTGLTTLTVATSDLGNTGLGGPLSDVDQVQIDVVAVVRPRARPDTFGFGEGAGPFSLDVLSNDLANLGGFEVTLESVGAASTGTVAIDDNGTPADKTDDLLSYTPPSAEFFGAVTFTYSIWDTMTAVPGTIPDHATATVTVNINNVNDAPVAAGDSYATAEDTPLVIAAPGVLGNDSDVDNDFGGPTDPQTAILVSNPGNGSVVLNADGSFTYTPNQNFSGSDSFTYRVRDGQGAESGTATVSIDVTPVNDAPVAVADPFSVAEDGTLNVAAPGVLGNDTDVDSPSTSFQAVLVSDVSSGDLTFNADGSFSYTPNPNFNGTDTFTYKLTDDAAAESNVATVTITVTPVNDGPVAVSDSFVATEDTVLNIAAPGVLGNDTDIDSTNLSAILASDVTSGDLTLNADGSFSFTPALNFTGEVTFTYRVSDGPILSNTATVTIDVEEFNDPPVADNDSFTTNEDTVLNAAAPGVLDGDTDPESSSLSAQLVTGIPAAAGTLVLNANGSFVYTPAANFFGSTSFTYRASDGVNNSNVATVTLNVTEVNDPPTAGSDNVVAIKDFTDQLVSVLGNDTIAPDVNETLSVTAVNGAIGPVTTTAGGSVRLSGGQILYSSPPGYTGADSFTYTLTDSRGGTATGTVNVNVIAFVPKFVSGTVFIDADADGQLDAGEGRLNNVEVRLDGTDFLGNAVHLVAFTDINGNYQFRGNGPQFLGVSPGNYTLSQIQPQYLKDGGQSENSLLASHAGNDAFALSWDALDFSGHITGLNFAETGINAASLADSRGLLSELLASSGQNGFVLATSLSGNTVWSWSLPGWSNMASCEIELDASLASATMRVTDKAGTLHTIHIHQAPSENTESNYPSGSMARFRILGRSATNDYIIRIDGTAADFGLNLLAASAPAPEGEGDMSQFAQAADAVFADEDWA